MQSNTKLSPSKAEILSKLVITRNIIKNKFRKAYTDRKKRERKVNEIMSPVITKASKEFKKKRII